MLTQLRTRWPIAAVLILVALILVQQFAGVPGSGRVTSGIQNAAHGPWFALVTYLLHGLVGRMTGRPSPWLTLGIALAVAVLTEVLQLTTGRDAEWLDVAFDMMGAGAALTFIAGRRGLAACLVLLSVMPALSAIATQWHRNAIFPELVSIAAPWHGGLLETNSATEVTALPPIWSVGPSPVLELTFSDTTWPGVSLPEPVADWSGYDRLAVDVWAHESVPLTVSIRLADADVDQVYTTFELVPGANALRMPFAELFDARVARVTMVVIFSTGEHAGKTVYLGPIMLMKN